MLPDSHNLLLFLFASFLLNITPGSDVLYIASQSLQSKKHGILATLGISTGAGIYISATVLGLAEILQRSFLLFNLIKLAGVCYLLYLAWQMYGATLNMNLTDKEMQPAVNIYIRGIGNTLLNPKVGIFFMTFLPQFVDMHQGKIGLQLLSLGICFVISGTFVNMVYVFMFAKLKERFFSHRIIQDWLNKFIAFLLFAIAILILL